MPLRRKGPKGRSNRKVNARRAATSGAHRRFVRRVRTAKGPKVAVLMGGTSRERPISLASGAAVVSALQRARWDVVPFDVRSCGPDALDDLPSDVQACFIALHGRFGEDGEIQGLLEERGVPYTGAGPEASALAFDKVRAKEKFRQYGVPTPNDIVLSFPWSPSQLLAAADQITSYPAVIKPALEGSSIGISIVQNRAEALRAITEAMEFESDLLIEDFIVGRELTLPIVKGLPLPLVEMSTERGFFDFDAKYKKECGTVYTVDPELPAVTKSWAVKVAHKAHKALGCEPFSRVDLLISADGRPWVLEVNTIPGLTDTSLLPKAARHVGENFSELCSRMLRLAFRRSTVGGR